jgi:hypothetical protein
MAIGSYIVPQRQTSNGGGNYCYFSTPPAKLRIGLLIILDSTFI